MPYEGHLVTFGIVPNAPETGYGYIQRGVALTADHIINNQPVFHDAIRVADAVCRMKAIWSPSV
ncbi:hypothetical protein G7B13_29710, partial [Klebsiella pneumoniae]|nr:hypothetical protein [Klebsiella pneumoniae]